MNNAINLSNALDEALMDRDWRVCGIVDEKGYPHEERYMVELETYSPAGEDVIVTFRYDGTDEDFVNRFREYAADFDPDEHAEGWIGCRGESGCPESIRELIEDAEAIKTDLVDTALKLSEALYGGPVEEAEESEAAKVYCIFDCDAWKSKSSMSLLCVCEADKLEAIMRKIQADHEYTDEDMEAYIYVEEMKLNHF